MMFYKKMNEQYNFIKNSINIQKYSLKEKFYLTETVQKFQKQVSDNVQQLQIKIEKFLKENNFP